MLESAASSGNAASSRSSEIAAWSGIAAALESLGSVAAPVSARVAATAVAQCICAEQGRQSSSGAASPTASGAASPTAQLP